MRTERAEVAEGAELAVDTWVPAASHGAIAGHGRSSKPEDEFFG
jgi:hypothetical protein